MNKLRAVCPIIHLGSGILTKYQDVADFKVHIQVCKVYIQTYKVDILFNTNVSIRNGPNSLSTFTVGSH